jgi:hypothetical protein
MTEPGCARAWQAAAAVDGRLADADSRSFQRHAATCETCEHEMRVLSALQETAARLPILTSTPLERRRLRNEVLRRANDLSLGSPRASWPSKVLVAACVLVVVLAGARWLGPLQAPRVIVQPAPPVPTFRIATSEGAEWRTLERSRTLRLSLLGGQFELTVDKLHTGEHFLLELPDGELEVKGTRFTVHVEGARTLAVRVEEGVVALRIRGQPSEELVAGDAWQPPPALPEVSAKPEPLRSAPGDRAAEPPRERRLRALPGMAEPPVAPIPATGASAAAARERAREGEAQGATIPSADVPLNPPALGHDFTIAMAAFSAGDYGRAERLLLEFERRNPSDARVEDSTFLRAVARSRRGDSTGAVTVAREYLRRYPNGLRRADA